MLLDHWTTGIGLGSYNLLSPIYLKGFPATFHFDRAHNEYLELVIELGAPFATILFCWIGGGMLKFLVRLTGSMKYNPANRDMNAIGAAAFCGLCGFLLHGVADFGWRLPVNLMYAVTLLSLLTVCLKPTGTLKKRAEDSQCHLK
jgi:O-antigen ligase